MAESANKISINLDTAKDLINTKQRLIKEQIENILKKWNQESAEKFVQMSRNGELEESEHDAIILTNLFDELNKLDRILKRKS